MNKIFYITIPLLILFLLRKKRKPMNNTEAYFEELIRFIQRKEGGTSKDPIDTASKNPAPDTGGIHTNKGVTWQVYKDSLGSLATPQRFLQMPDDDWLKIFKEKYYNRTKGIFDNDILSGYLSMWYWGGWSQKLVPFQKVLDIKNLKVSNLEKLKLMVDLRNSYFDKIVKNNPSQIRFLKGWKNVQSDYLKQFSKYLS
jgi:hypothetical protein